MSEWDDTPWAGDPPVKAMDVSRALTVTRPLAVKAITGAGVQAYANDFPLSSLTDTPQKKAAAYLRAYKCGWFYKAESKISGDLATLPWTVSDGDVESDDPTEATIGRPDLDIPIEALNPIEQFMRLMEKPNETKQTGRQLRQKTCIRRDMAGVGFWYLETSGPTAPITAIYGISPSRLWTARDTRGQLIGYALDVDSPSGPTMTFETWEIVNFSNASAEDGDWDIFGVGVVEAVYAELPLTELLTKHTADLLSTGGRLAGMLWPKERALNEDEFTDAQRAWRNVVSDPASARRLLLFPEPMEWAPGASTPAEIGIPELAALNRENILTAFPIDPTMLGVPMPSGINASGETRRVLQDAYWEGTIEPRATSFDEIVQTNIVSRYEAMMGRTFRYETELPKLDDASSLLEKAGAFRSLVAIGFDSRDTIKAVGLDHIKWLGLPDQLDPKKQAELAAQQAAQQPALTATVSDTSRLDNSSVEQGVVSKATKSRETIADSAVGRLQVFLTDQRERLSERIRDTFPKTKALRVEAVKADPWFDKKEEDALLRAALFGLYFDASKGSLQVVADLLDRIVPNKAVQRVLDDIAKYGGERITDINARTLEAITLELAEGTRRGYSIPQLIDGVPDEGFAGVKGVSLDNGTPVFGDARAETIARTETALSYNRAALDAYKEFNVERVLAYDGDYDEECAQRNGQEFTVEEALGIEDHPNGTLDWAPVVDKAAHFETAPVVVNNYIGDALKASAPSEVHVHVPEIKVPDVVADVNPLIYAIQEAARPEVDLAPIVKGLADLLAKDTIVNVPPPLIKVSPADVNVNVESVRVVSMPKRKHQIVRDRLGRPTEKTDGR